MELYINVKDKFLLWDYLHLNSQIFDINFSNVKVQNPDTDKYKDVTDTIKVTLKDNRQDEWAQRRQLDKLFATLKLFAQQHETLKGEQ
jgi:hypothetical protein